MQEKRDLAIIGGGPRGLSALESFCIQLGQHQMEATILIFEEGNQLGVSHVYELEQTESNWVNISERALELKKRPTIQIANATIPSFPSYHEWANLNYEKIGADQPDVFPPRRKIGVYLAARFVSIADALTQAEILKVVHEKVEEVKRQKDGLELNTHLGNTFPVHQAILTIGHQPTKVSKQIEKWEKYADENNAVHLFKSPYPIRNFFRENRIDKNSVIGIRGFGLAMIDVARGIVEELGGKFILENEKNRAVRYEASERTPKKFVPFSLNGLPMSPKPLNPKIDEWYQPTSEQINNFAKEIGDKEAQRTATGDSFLIENIAPIAADIFCKLKETQGEKMTTEACEKIITAWLEDESFEHKTILSNKLPIKEILQQLVDMATGNQPISLDYCVGQVWRHCQPTIYENLSYNECSNEVMAELVAIDERLKRYSYGPPVESLQQLIALINADAMTLQIIDDPDIEMTDAGWKFTNDGKTITANVMINSVLDAPKLLEVTSPIIKNLLEDDLIKPVHDELGIMTDEDAFLITETNKKLKLAFLGRLAKGTVIGVDAILECFGERSENWAKRAIELHGATQQMKKA